MTIIALYITFFMSTPLNIEPWGGMRFIFSICLSVFLQAYQKISRITEEKKHEQSNTLFNLSVNHIEFLCKEKRMQNTTQALMSFLNAPIFALAIRCLFTRFERVSEVNFI